MVLWAENGLRSDLRVYNFKKVLWQECAPVPLADAFYARCAHVTCLSWLHHYVCYEQPTNNIALKKA